jgi:hypothetical protein
VPSWLAENFSFNSPLGFRGSNYSSVVECEALGLILSTGGGNGVELLILKPLVVGNRHQ